MCASASSRTRTDERSLHRHLEADRIGHPPYSKAAHPHNADRASTALGGGIPIGDTGAIQMLAIGAILGNAAGMTAVTCALDDDLRAKAPGKGRAPAGNLSHDGDSSPRQVLVVDDELLIRWSVSETLADLGFAVAQAANAGDALRAVNIADPPFDVVVLDLRLPDMNDLSLLRTMRELLPDATLILMTAFGTAEIFKDARAIGATVLNKPFELAELTRAVSRPGTDIH